MTAPVRLRLSRAKGFDLQAHSLATNGLPAVNVARPTIYSNPFPVGKPSGYLFNDDGDQTPMIASLSREQAVEMYSDLASGVTMPEMHPWGHEWRRHLGGKLGGSPFSSIASNLRGKNLACWCALDGGPCHADTLLSLANPECVEVS